MKASPDLLLAPREERLEAIFAETCIYHSASMLNSWIKE